MPSSVPRLLEDGSSASCSANEARDKSMFSGSNWLSELVSQLHPTLCVSMEGTHSLLRVRRRPAPMGIMAEEIQESFREVLTVSAKLGGISFAGSD